MKYTALGEGSHEKYSTWLRPYTIFATQLSPQAVYFIQTGSSALSN